MGNPSPNEVRARLLGWYDANRRDLPWRRTRDPYRILVAEYLLQRTRIASGTPYYERFLERFPTVRDLAVAPLDDVLAVWEGQGFYGRARNLHAAAQSIVQRHGGEVPRSYDELASLPGIGPYTAGAVASIAFGISVPACGDRCLRARNGQRAGAPRPPTERATARRAVGPSGRRAQRAFGEHGSQGIDSVSGRDRGSCRPAMVARGPHLLPPEVVRIDLPLLPGPASERDRFGPLGSPGGGVVASSGAVPSGCDQGPRGTRGIREPIISISTDKYLARILKGKRAIGPACDVS